MIDTPTDNVKLSFDQLQAIDFTQKKLANLESEIKIANKNLKIVITDCDKVIKEKAYREEQLETQLMPLKLRKKNMIP